MADLPPPPDTGKWPTVAGQTVVEVIYSATHEVRGIITVDSKGIYRVRTQFWDKSDWEAVRVAFWNQGYLGTFTDTLDRARALCRESMAATAAP